ncbi:hypothetical protein HNP81_000428 [Peribacillus huizhouensis]|uniref:Uncharacterized protein n=1 Tax=Peribacillus huizhouensis TaxID=1501239 RepID=A0ABR6CKA4_9BACI|nr:hypothetical protein [Peribacillus huizhouensis]
MFFHTYIKLIDRLAVALHSNILFKFISKKMHKKRDTFNWYRQL